MKVGGRIRGGTAQIGEAGASQFFDQLGDRNYLIRRTPLSPGDVLTTGEAGWEDRVANAAPNRQESVKRDEPGRGRGEACR